MTFVLTAELGKDLVSSLGDRNACLPVHHGLAAVGADVPLAVMTACLLERACAIQPAAMSAGGPESWSPPEESLAKRDHCYGEPLMRGAWDYLVRALR